MALAMKKASAAKSKTKAPSKPIYSLLKPKSLVQKQVLKKVLTKGDNTPVSEQGSGKPGDPFWLPLRTTPNSSGCIHCVETFCQCERTSMLLSEIYSSVARKRVTEVAGARHLCAKSLLPPFVSRLIRLMNITQEDTFYDLGCGNGSVLFQVAFLTGARCVGVEISKHNAALANDACEAFKQKMRLARLPAPDVTIIEGDIGEVLSRKAFFDSANGKIAILSSNVLFPKSLTHFISDKCRSLPSGSRVACFDDFYPHSRSVAVYRDPDAFELFEMKDYLWQRCSVEWCSMEGQFYIHWRR